MIPIPSFVSFRMIPIRLLYRPIQLALSAALTLIGTSLPASSQNLHGINDSDGKGNTFHVVAETGKAPQTTREIKGWKIHINSALLDEKNRATTEKALKILTDQLSEIIEVVPKAAVAELRKVPLYFSPPYPKFGHRAEFHPDAKWLEDNGRDPAMAKGVEFTNTEVFEEDTRRMPNFTLHELAHAYHNRFLQEGFDNPDLKKAYKRIKDNGSYDKVERKDAEGRAHMDKAYALTDPMEYFAESTEAYFSINDFFPYNRKQLLEHDPEMHALVKKLWGQ